jgi:hemerythrin-like domain-containing protein
MDVAGEELFQGLVGHPSRPPARSENLREHHREEVGEAEALIQEMGKLEPTTEDEWMDKVEELQDALVHHIEEEEGNIWPRIERAWDHAKLEAAGQEMRRRSRRLRRCAADSM